MENSFSIHPPLSNMQEELLKLFATDVPEKHLVEIKQMIAKFLLDKARDKADDIWDKRAYSDEKLQEILNKE